MAPELQSDLTHLTGMTTPLQPTHIDSPIAGNPAPTISSTDLMRGQRAIEIHHNGATYRLQATRLGKLILTK